jgi:uncharacterized protein (UPF0548 family)
MLLLRKPTPGTVRSFLDSQAALAFSYEAVGATSREPPTSYVIDHTRSRLGEGEHVFAAAKSALQRWQQFRLGWLDALPANTPISQGETIAVVAHSLGLWWLNACRIAYVIDEVLERKKFGFAYGTLPDHAGSGEERFLIEMDKDGFVWYDILAFSRPHHRLARIGYPYLRHVQKRFGKQSAAVMQEVVNSAQDRVS